MTALDEWMSGIAAVCAGKTDSRIDKDNAEWSTEARYHGWVADMCGVGKGASPGGGVDKGHSEHQQWTASSGWGSCDCTGHSVNIFDCLHEPV